MGGDDKHTAATRNLTPGWKPPRRRSDYSSLLGRTLKGRYLLEREVGEGGFGVVFEAKDTRLEKRVAVKVLSPEVAENADALTRFKQEATAAARIGHKSIVDVTDFDQDDDGTHFMVMEFIDGTDLTEVLHAEGGPLPLARALAIASRVAQALAAAHERNIVHRDLKPANVLLTSVGAVGDFPKVLDFGISKIMRFGESSSTLTGAGQVVGTPRYMAPEQALGNREIDGRADIYALGTILYELATGQPPYTGATHYEVINNKTLNDALPPSVVAPQLDRPLEFDRLVLRALARQVEDRYPTMAEFDATIRDLLELIDPAVAASVRPSKQPPARAGTSSGEASRSTATRALGPTPSARRTSPSQQLPLARAAATPLAATSVIGGGRRTVYLAAGALALALVLLAVVVRRGGDDGAPAAPPRSAVEPPTAPPPQDPPRTPEAELVELTLVIEPAGALVELEGVAVTEGVLRLPRSEKVYALRVSAPGHKAETRELRPVASGEVKVKLEPETPAEPVKPGRGGKRGGGGRLPDSPL